MGLANKFVFTLDSANTWNEYFLPDTLGAYDLTFPDTKHGFAAGLDGMIFRYNKFLTSQPLLQLPLNGSTGISTSPVLSWITLNGADNYDLQVSNQPDFSVLVFDETQLSSTNFTASGLSTNTRHYWRVRGNNSSGSSLWSDTWTFRTEPASSITLENDPLPREFELAQNYPNPFNSSTHIKYALPVRSKLRISLYDIVGKQLQVFIDKVSPPGTYSFSWEADSNFPSGIYLLRMDAREIGKPANSFQAIRKIILLK
jgi:hypothetical protein